MNFGFFVARFVEGTEPGTAKWPVTIVGGGSSPDSSGRLRIDLRLEDALLAINEGHLRIDLSESDAISLAQTIASVSNRIAVLRELYRKEKLDPSALIEIQDDLPTGIPLIAMWPLRERSLLHELSGHVEEIRQTGDVLGVEIHGGSSQIGARQTRILFSSCRFVALRPSSGKHGLHVRLYKLSKSPFLMLAAEPEGVSHFVLENGDEDVCDVIAGSYELGV
ncbi:hypothetical protein [Sorangium sp. So ce1151]|uniref:hypothetical protein n=1 Tax=Sorangium sp. So ce1151 TaxID=3133332 RepID=UPI003F640352